MKEKSKNSNVRKRLYVLLSLIAVVMTSMTFAVSGGHYQEVSTAGLALPANSVDTSLNLSLSHLSYTTEPPQFIVNSSNYALNATYTAGGQWVTNATYQIFQHNASKSTSTVSALSYNYSYYVKNATYFFSDSKIGLNGTMTSPGLEIAFGNASYAADVSTTAMPSGTGGQTAANKSTAQTFFVEFNATASGSSYTYNATFAYWYLSSTGFVINYSKMSGTPLQALNMYEVQFNMQNGSQQVSVVYTNNGTVAQNTKILTNSNATKTPMLNFNHIGHASYVFAPTASKSGGFLFDWMYVVDKSTITYNTLSQVSGITPAISGSSANIAADPFDPSSGTGQSHYQAANNTATAQQASVSNNLVSNVLNVTNDTAIQNAVGMNNSLTTSYSAGMNSQNAIANTVYTDVSNISTTVNEQGASWSTQYINTVLVSFLKDYAAAQAEKNSNIFVSPNDITLVSYTVGSAFMDTNYSSSAASAIRDYLDNTYASILAANNLSIVNPTTAAIVAGAQAGDFYSNGFALSPIVHGNMIVDPANGHSYTLQSAGFAAGTFISAGAVIVPQYGLVGWASDGTPIFTLTAGISLGSIFSSLTSAGQSVSNLFESGASTIGNGIGSVATTIDNNVIKPISAGPVVSTVQSDMGRLISSATGITGTINQNIQGALTAGSSFLSGGVNSIKGDLTSFGSDASTAIMSGYNGVKTGIYSLGSSVNSGLAKVGNGLNGVGNALVNTVSKAVSTTTGALSTVYTKASNFIVGSASNLYTAVKGAVNKTLSALDSVGTTISKTGSAISNTFGNIFSNIKNGAKSVFSFFAGIPALVSHFLVYVGIGALVVVGLIIVIMVMKRESSGKLPGESGI